MLDLDIEQFWKDDELAHLENCFSKKAPQVGLGIKMSGECVFAELGEEGDPWGYIDPQRRYELNCRYNEKAVKIVGRPLLSEVKPDKKLDALPKIPAIRGIGEIYGGYYDFDGNTTWLRRTIDDAESLKKKLDEVDNLTSNIENFKNFVCPKGFDEMYRIAHEATGARVGHYGSVRGPVTLATSVFGAENLIYLYYDDEDLYRRFSESINNVLHSYITLFNLIDGRDQNDASHNFWFFDDDCDLLTPEMYEVFGYPVLKSVFERECPNPDDTRYQHSDSAMGHLLPILGRLNLRGCNFGPTVTVQEIRKYMPHTRIDGQLSPFTFMRNNEADIIAETRRDCEAAKENDLRGLDFITAGSINNGSLLTSMRTVMAAIQTYGRYDNKQ